MKIAFVHNKPFPYSSERPYRGNAGGAALTNVMIIQEGEKRGHKIDLVTKGMNYHKYDFKDVELVIMSHIPGMADYFVNRIIDNFKYVRWDHAYDFCRIGVKHMSQTCFKNICNNNSSLSRCRHKYNLLIHRKAILSVFQSPLHKETQERILGEKLKNTFILTPPIDTDHFKILNNVERKKNTCLVVGSISKHKGLDNVLSFTNKEKDIQFSFVGEPKEYREQILIRRNCKLLGKKLNCELPPIYNAHEYYIHLPQWWEPSSRSTMEAHLCGCKLITNERVGTMSFPVMKSEDKRKVIHAVKEAPIKFWEAVEKAYENS